MIDRRYSWILLDADDTLFDFRSSARRALQKTLTWAELPHDESIQALFERLNLQVWEAYERNEISVNRLRLERFERLLDAIGEYRDPAELSRHYLLELSQQAILLPGAEHFLETLSSQGLELVLVTNGLSEVQRPRLEAARFHRFFKHVVISDEIGASKPDPAFFDETFHTIGHPAKDEVLMVGDSLSSDIGGGNGYGLHTCWFNPDRRANLSEHVPTYEVQDFQKIIEIIQGHPIPPKGPA